VRQLGSGRYCYSPCGRPASQAALYPVFRPGFRANYRKKIGMFDSMKGILDQPKEK
jgi:hypothetical protein